MSNEIKLCINVMLLHLNCLGFKGINNKLEAITYNVNDNLPIYKSPDYSESSLILTVLKETNIELYPEQFHYFFSSRSGETVTIGMFAELTEGQSEFNDTLEFLSKEEIEESELFANAMIKEEALLLYKLLGI